jgi:hypothetical protein
VRPRIVVRRAARFATYAPDRHRDALPRQRATPSSRSAPEMKAARKRPGPPACTGTGGAEEGVGKKRKGGSAVVWTPAQAAIRRQLVVTKSWRDVRCRARQVQVRGWSESPGRTLVPQSHRRAGAPLEIWSAINRGVLECMCLASHASSCIMMFGCCWAS